MAMGFYAVSTSSKADGSRALGTFLGKTHPGLSAPIRQEYEGYAKLFGKDYMTVYRPVKDVKAKSLVSLCWL